MSKRFIETTIWTQNKWFRKLDPKYKLLWFYLISNSDSVGVWEEDIELASFIIKSEYDTEKVLSTFDGQIKVINGGKKWWIVDFCNFQYGELKEENIKNRPHQSYITLLKKHRLWIDYRKTMERVKEQDKEKDKNKDKYKDTDTIIDYLNECSGSEYRHSKASRESIHARLNDGFSLEDCLAVVEFYSKEWKSTEVEKYLRPTTLFGPKKFEGYVSAAKRWISKGRPNLKSNGRSFERNEDELKYPEPEEIFNE